MKKLILLVFIMLSTLSFAQMSDGHLRADRLDTLTITGNAIVVDSTLVPKYFLDTNNDGIADYLLNFGPYWYEPDSSGAQRPQNGDLIKITGGKYYSVNWSMEAIVVYEINDLPWRDPFFARWNDLSRHNNMFGWIRKGVFGGGYGFGWNHDTLTTVTLAGTALVDTTFYIDHYYLDVDNDGKPDYYLNFGPYWYEPLSGAVRPENGEQISITGGEILRNSGFSALVVYEINGLVWRDSTKLFPHFGGRWLNQKSDSTSFHAPFDDSTKITVRNGWHHRGSMMGGSMPDSIFCQLFETYPENMPNFMGENIFAGYEIAMFNPNGINMMWQNGRGGGQMMLGNSLKVQLHFSNMQLSTYNMNKEKIQAKLWDAQTNSWTIVPSTVDNETNTVTFSTDAVGGFIVLTSETITNISENNILPVEFSLKQNYPNPFNPTTTISYTLADKGEVSLKVYDILGKEVAELISGLQPAGNYQVNFDASRLSSGVYFYRLQSDNNIQVKKMLLLK